MAITNQGCMNYLCLNWEHLDVIPEEAEYPVLGSCCHRLDHHLNSQIMHFIAFVINLLLICRHIILLLSFPLHYQRMNSDLIVVNVTQPFGNVKEWEAYLWSLSLCLYLTQCLIGESLTPKTSCRISGCYEYINTHVSVPANSTRPTLASSNTDDEKPELICDSSTVSPETPVMTPLRADDDSSGSTRRSANNPDSADLQLITIITSLMCAPVMTSKTCPPMAESQTQAYTIWSGRHIKLQWR